VVVNFLGHLVWSVSGKNCRRLAQIAESYAGKPVSFVLISIDESKDRSKIPGVLQRPEGEPGKAGFGGDTDLMDRFGLGDIVPGTAIIDDQGDGNHPNHGVRREKKMCGMRWIGS